MFRFMRNSEVVKKYLLIFFLGIVSVGMVITLAPLPSGDTTASRTDVVAEIGGQSITTSALDRNIRDRLQNMTGRFSPQMASALAKPLLDEMIFSRAVEIQAGKLGLSVTDEEVLRAAQAIPGLYPDGKFIGNDRFTQLTGTTVDQFLVELRQNLLAKKMRSIITDGVRVAPAEVHEEFMRRNSKSRIAYLVFNPSELLSAVNVTPQALEDFYKKSPDRYKVPEERKVRYVLISPDRVKAEVQVTDEDLKRYYNQHLSDYRVPDRVKVEHILFKTTGKTPQEVTTLERAAKDVLAQIKAGGNFEDLARQHSEDTSAQQGGLIGWIVRGQTVKAFEDTAFTLAPGKVSDLVKTEYGIHILKVLDKQMGHLQTLDEVKEDIRQALARQKLEDAQRELAGRLEREFKADPQKFQEVAAKEGLQVKESPQFRYQQVIPDFGNSASFASLAFQLRPGEVGTPISVPKGMAIIQLIATVPPRTPPLDQIRAEVEQDYRAAQSKVLAEEKAKDFAAKAKGGNFQALARSMGLKVQESKDITERDYVEGLGSGSDLTGAFKLAPGQVSDVVSAGDNKAVFVVTARTPADETAFEAQKDQIGEELLQQKRQLAFDLYRQDLKQQLLKSGELKMNDATLKQFLATYRTS
jgi:peptidyl-prolyl cis-trans isomerase D